MYLECLAGFPKILVVSFFALAWLVVGILAGQRLPRGVVKTRKRVPRDKRAAGEVAGRGNELYVGNLAYEMDEKDLEREFARFGKVASARIIMNKFNGKSKGYGFVKMAAQKDSAAAVRGMSGKEMKGRRLVVNEAKSQARD